jgi:murein DD-endopeptidase MepM/ murein hydrolase activator NlpD
MIAKRGPRRGRIIPVLFACFYAGCVTGWLLHARFSTRSTSPAAVSSPVTPESRPHDGPIATAGDSRLKPRLATEMPDVPVIGRDSVAELRRHRLQLPIEGVEVDVMEGSFGERRGGGGRGHEAVDLLAPRHTPVRAVEGGRIAKLFFSKAGGTTIYQFDPTGRFCYYYAHLERYAEGLREGQEVSAGEVLGYVGTSGNAPANTPHLHFAIFELEDARRWWEGRPIDPYLVFRDSAG